MTFFYQNNSNKINRANINENYRFIRIEGGIQVERVEPKYNFICTYTARSPFITNANYSGTTSNDIMAISGHKTEKIFFNYIKVEKEVNALRFSKQ
ncbi:MAG: hypothetical protein KA210_13120 [Bacteroidia bacterium]|nr:hypothetical protein [Bacteroidia bacterium]